MLRRLEIANYGLIAHADVAFSEGATIFTGETGSGKTMLLGALDFVLGARAGTDVIRRGAPRAAVTLTFDPGEGLRGRLCGDGFDIDPGEDASVAREMNESGRSSVRVNGRPATAAYVRDIGESVAEIVGQHEAQRLLAPAYHLQLLDAFAGEDSRAPCAAVAHAHARAATAARELADLTRDEASARERYDDALHAAAEIEDARLDKDEVTRLVERRTYLDNVERIARGLAVAGEALVADDGGATGSLGAAAAALAAIERFDSSLRSIAQRASALQADANDVAAEVARARDATEFDSAELEAINARLDRIDRLKRKYGGDVGTVLEFAKRARETVDAYESRDRSIADCQREAAVAANELETAAAALTAVRLRAADVLSRRVVAELVEMALGAAAFRVVVEPLGHVSAHGADRVAFLFAANAGEAARPLAHVASGGELSRVLLALVVVLAGAREREGALVFDEIDAGIGGATAAAVGARIGQLAGREQVVCVTHLAQLATWADRHYVLDKTEAGGETTIAVRSIGGAKERETEIARMLSGETHDAALRHARALLKR